MNLWPHGKDLSLLFTIGNYFQSLLSNENRSKIKSKHLLQISSLRANIKSLLRQLTDTQVIPQTSISLQDIYNEYIHDESPWPNSITKISNTSSEKNHKIRSKRTLTSSSDALISSKLFLKQKRRLESSKNIQQKSEPYKMDIEHLPEHTEVSFSPQSTVQQTSNVMLKSVSFELPSNPIENNHQKSIQNNGMRDDCGIFCDIMEIMKRQDLFLSIDDNYQQYLLYFDKIKHEYKKNVVPDAHDKPLCFLPMRKSISASFAIAGNIDERENFTQTPPPSNSAVFEYEQIMERNKLILNGDLQSHLKSRVPPPPPQRRKKRRKIRVQSDMMINWKNPMREMKTEMDESLMNWNIGRSRRGNTHGLQYSPSMMEFRKNLERNLNSVNLKRFKPMVAIRINKHTIVPSVPMKSVESVSISIIEKSHEKTNNRPLPPTPR